MHLLAQFFRWLMNQLGYAVCHQFPERSFHYGGEKLPVCARDTGLFLGFAVCFVVLLLIYERRGSLYPSWPRVVILVLMFVPVMVDAATSYAGLRQSTNAIRVVTGALAGSAGAALFFPLACARMFGADSARRILGRWWGLPLVALIPVALSLLLWPDFTGAFWLWAPVVSLSILLVLAVLNYTLISLVLEWVSKDERRSRAGLVSALAAIAVLTEIVAANRLHWLADKLF